MWIKHMSVNSHIADGSAIRNTGRLASHNTITLHALSYDLEAHTSQNWDKPNWAKETQGYTSLTHDLSFKKADQNEFE